MYCCFLSDGNIWFYVVAIIHILYFGVIWPILVADRAVRIGEERNWLYCEKLLILYPQTVAFNFTCASAGWVALFYMFRIVREIVQSARAEINGGVVSLLIFLGGLAILGISAKLPEMIHRGLARLPGLGAESSS